MRPTPRLALVVLVAAFVSALAGFWGLGSDVARFSLLLLIPVGVDLFLLRRYPTPIVERDAELRGSLRRRLAMPIDIQHAVGHAEVVLDLPHVLGGPVPAVRLDLDGKRRRIEFDSIPRRRGHHQIGPVWITVESPLQLWARRFTHIEPVRVAVWPDMRGPDDDLLGRELEGEGATAAAGMRQIGSDLRGLHPFQSGDDPRQVDWKATARHGSPVVREWQPDRRRAVVIALDAGRLMRAEHDGESKFDAALRAMARLALAAELRGDQVGVFVFADQVLRKVPPLHGAGQAERLLRYVGDLEPRGVESDLTRAIPELLALGRRALVLIVTDVLDAAVAKSLVSSVARLSERHIPVVALLRDPHLDEAFTRPVRDVDGGFRRAAAELVVRERNQALELLRARGVRAFDLSMRAIALQVVQAYLDVRTTGRW